MSEIKVFTDDLVDSVCYCYAGLAGDSPFPESHYLNSVLNMLYGYLNTEQREYVEKYLSEKKYKTPVDIIIAK